MSKESNLEFLAELFSSDQKEKLLSTLTEEEVETLKDLLEKSDSKETYNLSPRTLKFLANLRPADITDLSDVLTLFKTLKTLSKFIRWIFIVLISTFVAAASLGDYISKGLKWLFGLH